MRNALFHPVAGHPTIAFLRQLAVTDEQRQSAAEIDLGTRLGHHVSLAETGLETLRGRKGDFLLSSHFFRRSAAAASTPRSTSCSGNRGQGRTTPRPTARTTGAGRGRGSATAAGLIGEIAERSGSHRVEHGRHEG